MNLYELTTNYLRLLDVMENSENPEDFQDTLESIEDAFEIKAENLAKIIQNKKYEMESLKKEEERLKERRKRAEKSVERLYGVVQEGMMLLNKRSFSSGIFKFSIRKNPNAIKIENEEFIPSEYYLPQAPKLDKTALKQAILNGLVVEGVTVEQSESLRIG